MPGNKQTIGDLVRFLQKFDLNADSSVVLADSDAKLYFQPYEPLFQAPKKSTGQGRMRLYGKVQKIQAIEKFEVSEEILLGFQTWLRDPYSFWTAFMTTWQSSPQQSTNDNYTAFLIGAFKAGSELEHHIILYRFRKFLKHGGVLEECKDTCINLLRGGKRRIRFCKKLRPVKEGQNIDCGPLFLLVFHDAIWDKRNVLEGKDLDDEIRRLQDKGINEWSESSGAWSAATAILNTCRRLIWDNSDTTSLMLSQQARHSATKSRQVQKRKAKGSEGPRAHNSVTSGHKRRHGEAPNDSPPIRVESAVSLADSMIQPDLRLERAESTQGSRNQSPQAQGTVAEDAPVPGQEFQHTMLSTEKQPDFDNLAHATTGAFNTDADFAAPVLSNMIVDQLETEVSFNDMGMASVPPHPCDASFGDLAPYLSGQLHNTSFDDMGMVSVPPHPCDASFDDFAPYIQGQRNYLSNSGLGFQEQNGNNSINGRYFLSDEVQPLAMIYSNAQLSNIHTSTANDLDRIAR
ncbi:hypothetical protein PT974_09914 [Cladobotryum mycophilum]|uniref:Uncharacterized protein n=1 Tax=Cladobotryum mycophilum TaxID=491253 RepID=A0ABR0SHH9_9HYPO